MLWLVTLMLTGLGTLKLDGPHLDIYYYTIHCTMLRVFV